MIFFQNKSKLVLQVLQIFLVLQAVSNAGRNSVCNPEIAKRIVQMVRNNKSVFGFDFRYFGECVTWPFVVPCASLKTYLLLFWADAIPCVIFIIICLCSARIVHFFIGKYLRKFYFVCKSKFTPRLRTFYLLCKKRLRRGRSLISLHIIYILSFVTSFHALQYLAKFIITPKCCSLGRRYYSWKESK